MSSNCRGLFLHLSSYRRKDAMKVSFRPRNILFLSFFGKLLLIWCGVYHDGSPLEKLLKAAKMLSCNRCIIFSHISR